MFTRIISSIVTIVFILTNCGIMPADAAGNLRQRQAARGKAAGEIRVAMAAGKKDMQLPNITGGGVGNVDKALNFIQAHMNIGRVVFWESPSVGTIIEFPQGTKVPSSITNGIVEIAGLSEDDMVRFGIEVVSGRYGNKSGISIRPNARKAQAAGENISRVTELAGQLKEFRERGAPVRISAGATGMPQSFTVQEIQSFTESVSQGVLANDLQGQEWRIAASSWSNNPKVSEETELLLRTMERRTESKFLIYVNTVRRMLSIGRPIQRLNKLTNIVRWLREGVFKYDEARRLAVLYAEVYPDEPRLWYELVELNEQQMAVSMAQESIIKSPKNPFAWRIFATILSHRKEWPQAAEVARKAVNLQPDNPVGYRILADILGKTGGAEDLGDGIAVAEKLLQDFPGDVDFGRSCRLLFTLYLKAKDAESAIRLAEQYPKFITDNQLAKIREQLRWQTDREEREAPATGGVVTADAKGDWVEEVKKCQRNIDVLAGYSPRSLDIVALIQIAMESVEPDPQKVFGAFKDSFGILRGMRKNESPDWNKEIYPVFRSRLIHAIMNLPVPQIEQLRQNIENGVALVIGPDAEAIKKNLEIRGLFGYRFADVIAASDEKNADAKLKNEQRLVALVLKQSGIILSETIINRLGDKAAIAEVDDPAEAVSAAEDALLEAV